jgi:hypothetical protein
MIHEDSLTEAARRAERAVNRAMGKYARAPKSIHEDDLTGVLIGNLDAEIEGRIGGLEWSSTILHHRRGSAAEEARIGADILLHVSLKTPQLSYSKGALIQAKRFEPGQVLPTDKANDLREQCDKMLSVTPASFVFNYARGSMRCGSATAISGLTDISLYYDCVWTSYRFFLEFFRCPVGDPRITTANVQDLPVPYKVMMFATSAG